MNREPLAGDLHFDEDENWQTGVDPDFYSVVLHEIGHALGLGHADRPSSVMYPYYRRFEKLQADDISAIRRLYASREAVPETVNTIAIPVPSPSSPGPSNPPSAPPQGTADKIAPKLRISFPATSLSSTSGSTGKIAGSASDNEGIAKITWSASGGREGEAIGSTNWSIPAIELRSGDNRIMIRAYDNAGNSSWRTVTITRR